MKELVEIQKELVKIIRNMASSQVKLEIKLNQILGQHSINNNPEELINKIVREDFKKNLNLNVRNIIEKSGIFEKISTPNEFIIECIDDDEVPVFVLAGIYRNLTDEEVTKNMEMVEQISEYNSIELKLVFIVRSANPAAKELSEKKGINILYSDNSYPQNPGLN
jgi:hypothetical protein